jgi:hypothetical protein
MQQGCHTGISSRQYDKLKQNDLMASETTLISNITGSTVTVEIHLASNADK